MCNCTNKPAFTMQMANATRIEKLTGKPQAVYTNGGIFFGELKAVKKLNICCYYTTDGKEHKIVKKK